MVLGLRSWFSSGGKGNLPKEVIFRLILRLQEGINSEELG